MNEINGLKEIGIMDIGGFKIGHAQDYDAMTGCTVILCDEASPAGVDVRGGGPASRETPLLNPVADAKGIHGILLSGGSAFGLDAAGGVMRYLEERNIGFDVGVTKVPLVCQSSLFDLGIGKVDIRPDDKMAYEACKNAVNTFMQEGNVGAGTGCTVGKIKGMQSCMKSGIGSYAVQAGALKVGAVVAVNALGNVYDLNTGKILAGVRDENNNMVSAEEIMIQNLLNENLFTGNTTLGIVFTNAKMDKTALNKVASMTHNGYARTIRPIHTTADGDSIYALSMGKEVLSDVNVVGTLGAYVMAKAINRAVLTAEGACGYPAAKDM